MRRSVPVRWGALRGGRPRAFDAATGADTSRFVGGRRPYSMTRAAGEPPSLRPRFDAGEASSDRYDYAQFEMRSTTRPCLTLSSALDTMWSNAIPDQCVDIATPTGLGWS